MAPSKKVLRSFFVTGAIITITIGGSLYGAELKTKQEKREASWDLFSIVRWISNFWNIRPRKSLTKRRMTRRFDRSKVHESSWYRKSSRSRDS